MTDNPYATGPSPDPYERFPVYEPAPSPSQYPEPSDPPAREPGGALPVPATPAPSYPVAHIQQPGPYPISDRQPPSSALLVVAWVVAVATGFDMLPWAIAVTRGKSNQWAIFAGNLLLGWTIIGWIVSLVNACGAHRIVYPGQPYLAVTAAPTVVTAPPGWYPMPGGYGTRYWDGQSWTAAVRP